jgi:hypothetical protein
MARPTTEERKHQVLRYLQAHADEWVDGTELANERVGGSEGLRRVRELRADKPPHRIITRPHPDRDRNVFQYKLVTPESINPVLQARLKEAVFLDAVCPRCGATAYVPLPATCTLKHEPTQMVAQVSSGTDQQQASPLPSPEPPRNILTPGMAGREFPMTVNEAGEYVLTKEVCVDCGGMYDDDLEHRTTSARHLRWEKAHENQLTIGVPEQPPPYKFTKMPERIDMSKMALCPRCKGRRRPERTWFSRKLGKDVYEPGEDFTRDPFKPTVRGEPNPCTRCGGFGVIPQYVEVPIEVADAPLVFRPPNTEQGEQG